VLNVLQRLWSEEKARPPLVLLGLIICLSLLWIIFGGGREAPKAETREDYKEVVINGRVKEHNDIKSLDSNKPMTVHFTIPELAYQSDAAILPDEDGTFEIVIRVPADKDQYSFDLDLSQGATRWRARSDQKIRTDKSNLDLAEISGEPPRAKEANPRAHLARKATRDPQAVQELREEHRRKRADRKEQRRQRRVRKRKR
jgi:hypothetical protein